MAINFDGVDDRIDLGTWDITPAAGLTLMGWVNKPSGGNDPRMICKATNNSFQVFNLLLAAGATIEYRLGIGAVLRSATGGAPAFNEWHHMCGVYNNSTIRTFLDGVQTGTFSISGSIDTGSEPVAIGDTPVASGREWVGLMDDVRIYERGLTDEEISQIAANRGLDTVTDYTHRWRMDEQADGTVVSGANSVLDTGSGGASGGAQDGTPFSAPVYAGQFIKTRRRVA